MPGELLNDLRPLRAANLERHPPLDEDGRPRRCNTACGGAIAGKVGGRPHMGEFDGKIAIITGGAMGIGEATARAFAAAGAAVSIGDIDAGRGEQVAGEVCASGGRAIFVAADVARAADCERLVTRTAAELGGVDILFSNAGIQPTSSYANVEDTPEEMWDRIQGVNLKSRFLMAKYAIPQMRLRGGGVIVNTASVQALQSMNLAPAYAATKGGDLSLTRQMALDYAAENIRVVAVCPGAIDTPLLRKSLDHTGADMKGLLEMAGRMHPIGRMGTGADIANAVLFLASDRASFITGEYLCVDGGLMAKAPGHPARETCKRPRATDSAAWQVICGTADRDRYRRSGSFRKVPTRGRFRAGRYPGYGRRHPRPRPPPPKAAAGQ